MHPIWLEDAEDQSKRLLTDCLEHIWQIINMQQAFFFEGREDEDSDTNNGDSGSGEISWYITVSNIILYL